MALYDRIGAGYARARQADPRIERAIADALGDAARVVNVGAGTGSYEPADREVVAVEPSELMIAQRPPGAAPAVRASAEALPFADGSFDAALAVLSDHHWSDRARGLRELRRVARRRAVVFTWDQRFVTRFWLVRDYLPEFAHIPDADAVRRALARLRDELASGAWHARNADLLGREEHDLGYRLLIAELASVPSSA